MTKLLTLSAPLQAFKSNKRMSWKSRASTPNWDLANERIDKSVYSDVAYNFQLFKNNNPAYPGEEPILDVAHLSADVEPRDAARVGKIDKVFMDGDFLCMTGTFDDTPLGRAAYEHAEDESNHVLTSVGLMVDGGLITQEEVLEGEQPAKRTVYMGGNMRAYVDHLALTSVPLNPEVTLEVGMIERAAKGAIRQDEDALAVLGDEELVKTVMSAVKPRRKSKSDAAESAMLIIRGQSVEFTPIVRAVTFAAAVEEATQRANVYSMLDALDILTSVIYNILWNSDIADKVEASLSAIDEFTDYVGEDTMNRSAVARAITGQEETQAQHQAADQAATTVTTEQQTAQVVQATPAATSWDDIAAMLGGGQVERSQAQPIQAQSFVQVPPMAQTLQPVMQAQAPAQQLAPNAAEFVQALVRAQTDAQVQPVAMQGGDLMIQMSVNDLAEIITAVQVRMSNVRRAQPQSLRRSQIAPGPQLQNIQASAAVQQQDTWTDVVEQLQQRQFDLLPQ